MKKLNGFNNGRDTTKDIGGKPVDYFDELVFVRIPRKLKKITKRVKTSRLECYVTPGFSHPKFTIRKKI